MYVLIYVEVAVESFAQYCFAVVASAHSTIEWQASQCWPMLEHMTCSAVPANSLPELMMISLFGRPSSEGW